MAWIQKIERPFIINEINSPYNRQFLPDFSFSGESHLDWEIVFVISGKIEVTEDEKVYWLSEGDIIFHAPMEFHRIKSADNTSPRVLTMGLIADGNLPEEITNGVYKLNVIEQQEFMHIHNTAYTFFKNHEQNPYVAQEIADGITAFILKLCRNKKTNQQLSASQGALAYRKLVKIMNDEIFNNLSVRELSEKSYLSVSYIKELFARYASISPKSYYNKLRVSQMARMINEGIPVKEIAEHMNFSSPNNLSLFFKKYMNMTPSQYKNMKN